MEVGDYIREARKRKGWSQRLLGEKISRSGGAVAQWETYQTVPAIEIRPQLSRLLDIPLEQLMPEFQTPEIQNGTLNPTALAVAQLLSLFPEPIRESYLLQIAAMADALGLRKGPPPDSR